MLASPLTRFAPAAAGAALLLLSIATPAVAETFEGRIAGSPASSSHSIFFAKVAELLKENMPDASFTVVNTGGIGDNHALLIRGQFDIIGSSSYESSDHYKGAGRYEGNANPDLRTLFYYAPAPQNVIVGAGHGLKSVADLDGKPFNAGGRGTTTETLTIKALEALGVEPEYFRGSIEDAISAFQDDRVVGITKASPGLAPDGVYQRLALQKDIVGLGYTPEEQAKIKQAMPEMAFVRVPADSALPGSPEVVSLLIPLTVITTTELPEWVAYGIAKTLHENQEEIRKVYTGTTGISIVEDAAKVSPIPLHAGAVRYLRDIGAEVPDEVVPPEFDG